MKKRNGLVALVACLLVLCTCVPVMASDAMNNEVSEITVDQVCSSILRGIEPARVFAHTFTYGGDPAAIEYVEKMKADEKIKKAVEKEATNPTGWWEWLNSLPIDSDITLDQQEVLEWFEMYITCTEEEKRAFSRNFMDAGGDLLP